eukprot:scaffold155152_cov19-Tisochrysis_lutea.AAC.4
MSCVPFQPTSEFGRVGGQARGKSSDSSLSTWQLEFPAEPYPDFLRAPTSPSIVRAPIPWEVWEHCSPAVWLPSAFKDKSKVKLHPNLMAPIS